MWFSDSNPAIIERVEEIAMAKGVSMTAVSIAWLLAKECWPIVGLAREDQLDGLLGALSVKLTDKEIKYLEEEYKPLNVTGI